MAFSRAHSNGSFRWSVIVEGATVRVERACVNFFEAEYGQQAYEELHADVPRDAFPGRADLHDVIEQGLGTEALDALLVHLGAPPSGRTPTRQPAPQVGPGAALPATRGEAAGARPSASGGRHGGWWRPPSATLGSFAVVLALWAVLGLPGLSLARDAWAGLGANFVPVEGVVLSTQSRGLVTHAVGGKGSAAPLRRYEGDVALRVPGERVVTLTVTEPDIVKGEAALQERLAPYADGARVALQCRQDEPTHCRFEDASTTGTRLAQVTQLLFGAFLFLLVPGLLAFGLGLGRRA